MGPGEWAVLGVIAERPTHGFAVAQALAVDGALGRIWTVPRPVVYQVVKKLVLGGMVRETGSERSAVGPTRTLLAPTPAGLAALRRWLTEPVDHVRDVRSLLLLKLALLDRRGGDPAPLLQAQADRLLAQIAALEAARNGAVGFDRVLLEWRLAGTRATRDFVEAVR
jgi:DNA-binding PadR family transcriptional regulator